MLEHRRNFIRFAWVAIVLAALPIAEIDAERSAVPAKPDDATIVHVLNRIGFGPAPRDIARVRQQGLAEYIELQLHPERIADQTIETRLASFATLRKSSPELAQQYFIPAMIARQEQQRQRGAGDGDTPRAEMMDDTMRAQRQVLAELMQQKILRAIYSERQLQEVMVDFWFNHFNVFAGKGQVRLYLTEYERDTIRPRVFGRFRDLLQATTESPAMLFYLDNWQSSAPMDAVAAAIRPGARLADTRRPRGINENYARELMELHTLGVDGGYTQKDVQEVARAFTGWTLANPRGGGGFRFNPRMHDEGEKIVLGHRLKAGGGRRDGEQVLDILASHPSTAQFIATKLARRFIADDPPKSLVDRAALRFRQTDGDIREVVRTIVTSPEFFAKATYRVKVKSPFEFVTSAVRAAAIDTETAMPIAQALRELGMPLYGCQPPTGYPDSASAWINSGALLNRMNFALAMTSGRRGSGAIQGAALADARDALVNRVLAGDLSPATRDTIEQATTAPQLVALVLGSPEFQKR